MGWKKLAYHEDEPAEILELPFHGRFSTKTEGAHIIAGNTMLNASSSDYTFSNNTGNNIEHEDTAVALWYGTGFEDWKLTNARIAWSTNSTVFNNYAYGFALEKATITNNGMTTTGLTRLADKIEWSAGLTLDDNKLLTAFFPNVNSGTWDGNGEISAGTEAIFLYFNRDSNGSTTTKWFNYTLILRLERFYP